MAVHRRVTVTIPVTIQDNRASVETHGNLTYEPLDSGLIQVRSNFADDVYFIEPKDLIELVIAVSTGVLLKQPDMQRELLSALGLNVRGDDTVEFHRVSSDD